MRSTPWLRVEQVETKVVERHAFHQPYLIVGRASGSHLLLPNWEVSRRHALLVCLGDRVFAIDLGSRTGISPIDEADRECWMEADLGLRIGPFRLFPGTQPEGSAAVRTGWEWTERPRHTLIGRPETDLQPVTIQIEDPTGERRSELVDRVISLVGREAPAEVVLSDPGVSKIHAALVLTPMGLWVVDLCGRGGVLIDGVRVRHVQLVPGRPIQIGRYRLSIEAGSEAGREVMLLKELERSLGEGGWSAGPGRVPLEPQMSSARGLARREEMPQLLEPIPATSEHAWLVPVLQHISSMQQQMMDQFNQSLVGALQSFGTLHRDTVSALREELAELRRLNEELATLQAQAHTRAATGPEVQAGVAAGAERAAGGVSARSDDAGLEEAARGRMDREGALRGGAASGAKPEAASLSTEERRLDREQLEIAADTQQVHLMLHRRIQDLQRERQTRWQRILNVIQGAP